jgi:predicted metal-dependent HD superfamily phosphohydrolase
VIDRASFTAAWQQLGAQGTGEELHGRLVACWSEKHRRYHTLQHLRECCEHFDNSRADAKDPAQIEIALWFHDSFYDPKRDDNEQRSADWARDAALEAGIEQAIADRLHAMVMATRHAEMPDDADTKLLVDIDLSILGAPPGRFDESNDQIRREYAHVPEHEWRIGRKRVLREFLARPRLYGTERYYAMLETRARENLQRALAELDG